MNERFGDEEEIDSLVINLISYGKIFKVLQKYPMLAM